MSSIFKVVTWFQPDVAFQRFADLGYHLLDISIAHVHTDDDAPLGGIAVDLQRTVDQPDGGDLAHRQLLSVAGAHVEAVQVQVAYLLVVQPDHQVETPFILKYHAGRLAGVCRADDVIQFLYVDAVACYLSAVILHHQLR